MAERSIVRELVTVFGFETDEKAIRLYETRVADLRKSLRRLIIVGGLVAGSIALIATRTARAGDNIAKTSRRLGLSTQALQEWRFAADRGGIGAQTFDMAVQRFGRRAAEAAKGTGEAIKALAEMKIALRDNNGELKSLDELLEASLIGLAGQKNDLDRNRLAMKLFDSEGVRMVQMLEGGIEKTLELRKRARELGGVMDDDLIKMSEEAVDAWSDFGSAMNGVIYTLGKQLLPVITDLLIDFAEWIAKNRELIATIVKVVGAVLAVVVAILSLLTLKAGVLAFIALVKVALTIVLAKVLAIIAAIAAVILLAQDIALFFTSGGKAKTVTGELVNGLKKLFDMLKDWITDLVIRFMPDSLLRGLTKAREIILSVGDDVLRALGQRVERFIDDVFPQWLQDILKGSYAASILGIAPEANPEMASLGRAARRLGQSMQQGPTQGGARVINNVTINQTPGETGRGVANEVMRGIGGSGANAALVGLGQ